MKSGRWVGVCLSLFLFAVATATVGQNRPQEEPSWAPKPVEPTKWVPPNKPHTKLSEVKAKHKGEERLAGSGGKRRSPARRIRLNGCRRQSLQTLSSGYPRVVGGYGRTDPL